MRCYHTFWPLPRYFPSIAREAAARPPLSFFFIFHFDRALRQLKLLDALTDQIQYLPVGRPPLILGDVVQLVMQLRVYLYPQMLIVLISHKTTNNLNLSTF